MNWKNTSTLCSPGCFQIVFMHELGMILLIFNLFARKNDWTFYSLDKIHYQCLWRIDFTTLLKMQEFFLMLQQKSSTKRIDRKHITPKLSFIDNCRQFRSGKCQSFNGNRKSIQADLSYFRYLHEQFDKSCNSIII